MDRAVRQRNVPGVGQVELREAVYPEGRDHFVVGRAGLGPTAHVALDAYIAGSF